MIKVLYCGINSQHANPCNIEHKNGLSNYLLLLVKSEAWFHINDEIVATKPYMAILFNRKTYIHYGCNTPAYNDDWIHFDMDESENEALLTKLHIPMNYPIYVSNIHLLSNYAQLVSSTFHSHSHQRENILNSLMHALLYMLDASETYNNCLHKHHASIANLRSQLYSNPSAQWSGAIMAERLNLSISYFQHLYKQFFGCSCQQDIIFARLEKAKFYLANSDMTIKLVSEFCGWDNDLHFMRQFKKAEGLTPTEYRNINHHSVDMLVR